MRSSSASSNGKIITPSFPVNDVRKVRLPDHSTQWVHVHHQPYPGRSPLFARVQRVFKINHGGMEFLENLMINDRSHGFTSTLRFLRTLSKVYTPRYIRRLFAEFRHVQQSRTRLMAK